ncbi:hypothetical protein D3C73_906340 [compost metagenome]
MAHPGRIIRCLRRDRLCARCFYRLALALSRASVVFETCGPLAGNDASFRHHRIDRIPSARGRMAEFDPHALADAVAGKRRSFSSCRDCRDHLRGSAGARLAVPARRKPVLPLARRDHAAKGFQRSRIDTGNRGVLAGRAGAAYPLGARCDRRLVPEGRCADRAGRDITDKPSHDRRTGIAGRLGYARPAGQGLRFDRPESRSHRQILAQAGA